LKKKRKINDFGLYIWQNDEINKDLLIEVVKKYEKEKMNLPIPTTIGFSAILIPIIV